MRREIRIIIATFAVGGIAVGAEKGVRVAEESGWLRVSEVDFIGLKRVSRHDALAAMEINPRTSMLTPPAEWSSRLESHPLVHTVKVRLRFPRKLRVTVREREPVALVPTPVLVPTDPEGWVLPINPTEMRLDLPIVNLDYQGRNRFTMPGALATLIEMGRLAEDHPGFVLRVSEVVPLGPSHIAAYLSDPSVVFIMPHGVPASRIDEGIRVLNDAMARSEDRLPAAVDLRFADQVVLRSSMDVPKTRVGSALIQDTAAERTDDLVPDNRGPADRMPDDRGETDRGGRGGRGSP